ncbi:hypothetical protein IFM46972_10436 [Aspergillus udagawae]|uniref:Uncharacterized protein n=1 Tax=Aspergillus udagawae TaxID=91492 RepID=A0A8H3SCW0_9EURO|nr:hypothetical protein IFM46972_10436 [Aspergillus udagawae]
MTEENHLNRKGENLVCAGANAAPNIYFPRIPRLRINLNSPQDEGRGVRKFNDVNNEPSTRLVGHGFCYAKFE